MTGNGQPASSPGPGASGMEQTAAFAARIGDSPQMEASGELAELRPLVARQGEHFP